MADIRHRPDPISRDTPRDCCRDTARGLAVAAAAPGSNAGSEPTPADRQPDHIGWLCSALETNRLPVAAIVILGRGELEGLHGPRERDLRGSDQQMHVIGHQDAGIAMEAISLAVAFKALEIRVIIRVAMKEGWPAVAASDHMIGRRLGIPPSGSVPWPYPSDELYISQYSCLTPFLHSGPATSGLFAACTRVPWLGRAIPIG